MYQLIGVDDWSRLELAEILQAMPPGSVIVVDEPSDKCGQMWDEPISERRN